MRPDDIRAHLRAQPIRVYLSDGSSYEVRHPELMLVTRTEVVIGLGGGDDELPERSVYCDPVHIARIQPIDGTKQKRNSKRRGSSPLTRLEQRRTSCIDVTPGCRR